MIEVEEVNRDRNSRIRGCSREEPVGHEDLQDILTVASKDVEFLEIYTSVTVGC